MKGHTRIIRADGTEEYIDWQSMPSLKWWQSAVGGNIEAVPFWPQENAVVFCNEEGKLKGLPINHKATRLWGNPHDVLVGDIVIITGDAAFMRAL